MEKSVHTAAYAALRAALRSLREEANLSQRELAARLDVPHSWVAKVESGERRIDFVELCWLIEALDREPNELLPSLVRAAMVRKQASKGGRK
jgi:transcriptional regulator with XRE-family HTH domain